jgi:hypothetical protein
MTLSMWQTIPHREIDRSVVPAKPRTTSGSSRHLVKLELDLMPEVKSAWGCILADTTTDCQTAERTIDRCYEYIGRPRPHILWAENPLNAMMILLNRPDLVDVGAKILGSIWNSAHAEIYAHIAPDSVRMAMAYTNPRAEIVGNINTIDFDPLGEYLNRTLRRKIAQIYPDFNLNSIPLALQDYRIAYLSYFDFFQQIGIEIPQVQLTIDLAKSCGWCWAFENLAIVCPKPSRITYGEESQVKSIEYDWLNILDRGRGE